MKRLQNLILSLSMLSFTPLLAQQNGEEVIRAMNEKYKGKWYNTLKFVQKTTFYRADTIAGEQTWLEALKLPSRLIVKFGDFDSGNGMTFVQDTQRVFRQHKLVATQHQVHDLLLLGFDVYAKDPDLIIQQIKNQGYDLSKLYVAEINNKEVYVVGASSPDDRRAQFWIDKEKLVFLKLWKKEGENESEIFFNKYEPLGDGWIAPEVIFKVNDKIVMLEEYSEIEHNIALSDSLFLPEKFNESQW